MEYLKFDLNPGNVARFKFYPNRVLMSNGLFYSNLDPKSFFFIFFRWGWWWRQMFDGGCAICDAKAMKFNLSQAETFFYFHQKIRTSD